MARILRMNFGHCSSDQATNASNTARGSQMLSFLVFGLIREFGGGNIVQIAPRRADSKAQVWAAFYVHSSLKLTWNPKGESNGLPPVRLGSC